ncbi:MAG: ABC transporter ATP-binding protein [Acidimicrobiia bacterium]
MTALLAVTKLEAGYGFPVISDLNFTLEEGETALLLGLNGAGKTTTLSALAGLLVPSAGTVTLGGVDLTHLPASKRVRHGIALVPEGRRVFPGLSVATNLRLGAWSRRSVADLVQKLRATVYEYFPRLAERESQLAGTLSGGEQQMLAIGRALMSGPRLLLVDEASLGLSPAMVQTVFDVVRRIADDGVTVLMVEQNAGALALAARVLVMEKGRLVYDGPGEGMRSADLQARYLGAPR